MPACARSSRDDRARKSASAKVGSNSPHAASNPARTSSNVEAGAAGRPIAALIEAAFPFPLVSVVRHAGAQSDRPDADVAMKDVPFLPDGFLVAPGV
jgi:hypothetical protein